MSEPVRIDPSALLAQTAWVRRLALSLSRDEASADDLAQDALVAALRKPPPNAGNEGALRAWFAAVARNLAIHRARGDSRRDRREREVARPELERSQERLRELEELRGELVKHVLTLPEVSQQVVLLHFFEELDSAEIARRLGVPDSTIRNRLRRALAELRVRIECRHGADWRNLCLFVVPSAGAKVAAGTSVVAAAGGLWIGGGAVVVLALALLFTWAPWQAEKLDSSAGAALAALPSTVDSKSVSPPSPEGGGSESGRAPEALQVGSKPFLLYGRVYDAAGTPVTSGTLRLEDVRGSDQEARLSTEGWYSFPSLTPAEYDVRVDADGGAPLESRLDLRSASGQELRDFRLEAVHYIQVRIMRPDGTLWIESGREHSPEREHDICVVATQVAPGSTLGPSRAYDHSRFGIGRFRTSAYPGAGVPHLERGSSAVLEVYGALPAFASLCQAERVLETKPLESGNERLDFVLDEEFVRSLAARARVIVIDERTGAPAPGVEVKLGPTWTSAGRKTSDAEGVIEFLDLPTGELEIRPGGSFGGIWRLVRIAPGEQCELGNVPWLPARDLRATVRDSRGEPAEADIRLTLDDAGLPRAWRAARMSGKSDASGQFRWQYGPGFTTTIVAQHRADPCEAGAATLPRDATAPVEIRMRPARLLKLRRSDAVSLRDVRLRDAQGLTWAETGLGGTLALPDGEYTLEVLEEGRVARRIPVRVDAETRWIELDG